MKLGVVKYLPRDTMCLLDKSHDFDSVLSSSQQKRKKKDGLHNSESQ